MDHDKSQVDTRKKILHHKDGQMLKQVAQRGSGISITEDTIFGQTPGNLI